MAGTVRGEGRAQISLPPSGAAAGEGAPPLSAGTLWLLAVGAAFAVANLYYGQPLLADMARDLGVPEARMGVVSALGQAGYALGLLFFVPLGDVVEVRRLILTMLAAVTAALVAVALAPGVVWLSVATLVVGMTTITPQLIVPLAAGLAEPSQRGRVVGRVMSGLLIGVLLSRTVSGLVGARLGWRAMYALAAGLSVALAFALAARLPARPARVRMPYGRLLRSVWELLRTEPVLREACLFGAVGFGAFSAFWTTLAFYLAGPPYRLGSDAVGLFGLAGAAGALAAPLAGRFADVRGPRVMIGAGLAVMLASFGLFVLSAGTLWGLAVGVVVLDMGAQANHISNQTRIYRLPAEAHNRLNTAYMVSFFVGGSAGSALGAYGWALWGWAGVCAAGAGLLALGLATFAATARREPVGSKQGAGGSP